MFIVFTVWTKVLRFLKNFADFWTIPEYFARTKDELINEIFYKYFYDRDHMLRVVTYPEIL